MRLKNELYAILIIIMLIFYCINIMLKSDSYKKALKRKKYEKISREMVKVQNLKQNLNKTYFFILLKAMVESTLNKLNEDINNCNNNLKKLNLKIRNKLNSLK